MNLYLNYARQHWVNPDENPPVGLILCSERDAAVAHYSLESLGNTLLARESYSARRASTCRATRVDPQPLAVVANGKRMIQASSFQLEPSLVPVSIPEGH
jgi:hypothetical protein